MGHRQQGRLYLYGPHLRQWQSSPVKQSKRPDKEEGEEPLRRCDRQSVAQSARSSLSVSSRAASLSRSSHPQDQSHTRLSPLRREGRETQSLGKREGRRGEEEGEGGGAPLRLEGIFTEANSEASSSSRTLSTGTKEFGRDSSATYRLIPSSAS